MQSCKRGELILLEGILSVISKSPQLLQLRGVVPTTLAYQRPSQQGNQGYNQRRESYDHIPMSYTELLPELIQKKLAQTRPPPAIPSPLPWYYKADQTCVFHHGAPGHIVENCYPLKTEVQKLEKSGILSFKDVGTNVKDNHLPKH